MTKRCYYAATLTAPRIDGDDRVVDEVFIFTDFSMRKQWVSESDDRITLRAEIAKKHRMIEVDFGQASYADGSKGWVWFYDGYPDIF